MVACRMTNIAERHDPVLLSEVMENLAIKPDGLYVDATFGRGGHTQAILSRLGPTGKLIAFDKDPDAVVHARAQFSSDPRFTIVHASYAQIKGYLAQHSLVGQVNGFLFDLGVSSPQLDNPNRGFSFMRAGKLDMRMDTTRGEDASAWLSRVSEKELTEVLWKFGEERFARQITRAIIAARNESPIITTNQLADIIAKVVPARIKGKHPATKSFQAIRIAVNHELDELQQGLEQAFDVLKVNGRLLVISFHSLEDRIVKHFIQDKEWGERLPAKLPVKQVNTNSQLKRVGRAIKPSEQEIAGNPRARSAILRIAEKLS